MSSSLRSLCAGAICGVLAGAMVLAVACSEDECPEPLPSVLKGGATYALASIVYQVWGGDHGEPEHENPMRPSGVAPRLRIDRDADIVTITYEVEGNTVIETWQILSYTEGVLL